MTTTKTATHRLIEIKMGSSLKRLVRQRRREERSWQRIADEIAEKTDIRVSDVALRNWFRDID